MFFWSFLSKNLTVTGPFAAGFLKTATYETVQGPSLAGRSSSASLRCAASQARSSSPPAGAGLPLGKTRPPCALARDASGLSGAGPLFFGAARDSSATDNARSFMGRLLLAWAVGPYQIRWRPD